MRKIITIILFIILIIVAFLAYMGLFNNVTIIEKEIGPYTFAYEDFTGDYAKTGPVFDEVYDKLIHNKIKNTNGLGIYYDNPEIILKENLKSRIGSIVSNEQAEQIDKRGVNLKIMTVDSFNAAVSEFPYRNKLSIIFGVFKVYPVLNDYMKSNEYKKTPSYELYDISDGKILYMFPIIK